MYARLIASALVGVALGAMAMSINPLQSAPAPEAKPAKWEYKVVNVTVPRPADGSDASEKLSEQFNVLAKDGWELVGPVVSRGTFQNYVAFRRAK